MDLLTYMCQINRQHSDKELEKVLHTQLYFSSFNDQLIETEDRAAVQIYTTLS